MQRKNTPGCTDKLTSPKQTPKKSEESVIQVPISSPSGIYTYGSARARREAGRGGKTRRATRDNNIPRDYVELALRYGKLIRAVIIASGVREGKDAFMAILLRMQEVGFIERYDPALASLSTAVVRFASAHVLRHLKDQIRRDARNLLIADVDVWLEENDRSPVARDPAALEEPGYAEVEFTLLLEQTLDSSIRRGQVLYACAFLAEQTGAITGTDLAPLLGVSAEMARRYLRALDVGEVGLLVRKPVTGTYFLDWWILYPATFAALGAAAVIVLAVELAVPDTASAETKEIMGTLATGITAFITTIFITWSQDATDPTLANHIRGVLQEVFPEYKDEATTPPTKGRHYFRRGSRGLRLVFSEEFEGISGWDRQARLARSKGIKEEIVSGNSEPSRP